MLDSTADWTRRHREYWQREGRERATSQLVGTCAFILICQFAFIGLDRVAFPEHFPLFATMRLAVNVGVVGVLVSWRHRFPNACQIGVALAISLEILVMIYAIGESDSLYFAGLIIVLVGIPVLQPISVRGSLFVSSVTVGGFLLCVALSPTPIDERASTIQLIFILTAALESAMSCHALAVNRVVNFEQRQQIEAARDQLASLDEAKTRFTANVHHELRTPLTLILAPLESLRSGDLGELPEPVQRTLRTMHVNGQRLLKLINDLLDLAKLESDRFAIHRSELDLGAVVEEVVEGARPLAERKRIQLGWAKAPETPRLHVDRDALEKVIVNLLGNALKFTEADGQVSVDLGPAEDGARVLIRVRDSGIGIAREDLRRVFDRFAQADGSATREHEGTGIGLALTRELVELHEGEIWAESEGLGHGTTICVRLPIGEADRQDPEALIRSDSGGVVSLDESLESLRSEDGMIATSSAPGAGIAAELEGNLERWESRHEVREEGPVDPMRRGEKPRIVIADDNRDIRELLQLLLGRDFSVHEARDGREALELVRQVRPDLVVTDIMMPEMTGTELCQAIKGDPEIATTPVMLVSSKAESAMKVEGLEQGADDYVTKPFHPRELLARARGLVRLRVLQREIEDQNAALANALQELKAAEVQLVQSERLAAVGELAAGVAHEVNNPVNFALNAARMLRSEIAEIRELATWMLDLDWKGAAQQADGLEKIHARIEELGLHDPASTVDQLGTIIIDGLERTHRLVAELRDFAAPHRTGRVEVDLARGIQSTVSLLRPAFRAHGVELELAVPEHLPPIQGDPSALNQVLLNLLKNAAEAMEKEGGHIRIEADTRQEHVEIRICDDGPGIPPEIQGRLFEPFFTTKDAGKGTGLGLSISRRIVDEHGGSLDVTSELGIGTTFTLSLPRSELESDRSEPAEPIEAMA